VCLGLDLSQDQIYEILKAGASPDKEMLKTVINTLDKVQYQILFLLDAQILLKNEEIEKEIVEKLVVSFMQLFKMSVESQKSCMEISNAILNISSRDKEDELQKLFNTEVSSIVLGFINSHLFVLMLQRVFNSDIQNVYNFSAYHLTDNFNTKMQDWNLVIDEIKKCIIKEEQEIHKLSQDIATLEKEKQSLRSTVKFSFGNIFNDMLIDESHRPRWNELNSSIIQNKELKKQKEAEIRKLKQNSGVFQKEVISLQTALDSLYIKN